MPLNVDFYPHILETVLGGRSAIDLPRLELHNLAEAYAFAKAYGYDLDESNDLEEVWSLHRRSVSLIREELLNQGENIPQEVADPAQLQDIGYLLVFASSLAQDEKSVELQRWSCAILRVMHAFAHIENDVFINYGDQIQEQILSPFRRHLIVDPVAGTTFGLATDVDQVPLHKFEVKPFKARSSSVIKLLSKPQAVAFNLLDKIGVRFVAKNIFDCFRVVRLLHRTGITSFPNCMPDQSRNNIYPLNLMLETIKDLPGTFPADQVDAILQKKLADSPHRAEFLEKANEFSASEYRAMKFIDRKLIEVKTGDRKFHFFFPFEIQVVDYNNYVSILSGPGSHEAYKERQREAARKRVLGGVLRP